VTQADPLAVLRSRSYLGLLVFAAIIGVPVSAAAYGLKIKSEKKRIRKERGLKQH
jgi:hypothetical protein